jgi:hypothetical protein
MNIITIFVLPNKEPHEVRVFNLTRKGLCFIATQEFEVMTDVLIKMDEHVTLKGKVIWFKHDENKKSKDVYHGVRFYQYKPEVARILFKHGVR